ncbi:hypothetical protein PR048_021625, partial [Dryococelus australis]
MVFVQYVGLATVQVAQPLVQGEVGHPATGEGQDGFWHTSVGKFCFALQDLPEQLQFIYHLLKVCPSSNASRIFLKIFVG